MNQNTVLMSLLFHSAFPANKRDENHETKPIGCIVSQSESVNQRIGDFFVWVHERVSVCACIGLE